MRGLRRCLPGALLAATALAAAPSAHAQTQGAPLRIHVRGSAQIEAVAWTEVDAFVVRGSVVDDARSAIADAPLAIDAVTSAGAPVSLPAAESCAADGGARAREPRPSQGGYAIATDERGGFCVRGRAPLADATLRIRFAGGKLYDAVEAKIPIEAHAAPLAPVILRFDPPVDAIDLDRPTVNVTVALRIDRSGARGFAGAAPFEREQLSIVLEDERGAQLAEAPTGGDGRARFEVPTDRVDGAGQGALRARFDGTATLAKASVSQGVVRYAQVTLALSHPIERARAEDGVPVDVDVRSSRGPVEGGVVEALRAGEPVGAAAVSEGKARVIAAFTAEREGTVPISLRYVPASPWWIPGAELAIDLPVAGPGAWRQLALGAAVLAIAGWVLGGWRRAPKRAAAHASEERSPAPPGRAGVRVMGPLEGATGWRGAVADAHDGTPIARAELVIVVPAFDGSGVVARAVTDDAGEFSLEAPYRSDAKLVVRAPTHSSHEQALPSPSKLGIALVTRRRAVLDRLVRWARRHGAPFEGPPEPTPGHVRRVASRVQQREVELWASRIEHAAFGPDPVDERLEQDLGASEPKPGVSQLTP
ncbi:carboxypeptidase regulatory-like domain-containing protein [Sorangium sp. So ce1000]|uniref:carboxypeptidase regulatory-like domain-containing protein n=1 Tax=Sorangium sp. So ce1000 TaxID=3133325 RepID=UPI003F60D6DF